MWFMNFIKAVFIVGACFRGGVLRTLGKIPAGKTRPPKRLCLARDLQNKTAIQFFPDRTSKRPKKPTCSVAIPSKLLGEVFQAYLQPWKTPMLNLLDSLTQALFLTLLGQGGKVGPKMQFLPNNNNRQRGCWF